LTSTGFALFREENLYSLVGSGYIFVLAMKVFFPGAILCVPQCLSLSVVPLSSLAILTLFGFKHPNKGVLNFTGLD
jgi:hypothetical protein